MLYSDFSGLMARTKVEQSQSSRPRKATFGRFEWDRSACRLRRRGCDDQSPFYDEPSVVQYLNREPTKRWQTIIRRSWSLEASTTTSWSMLLIAPERARRWPAGTGGRSAAAKAAIKPLLQPSKALAPPWSARLGAMNSDARCWPT